MRKNAARIAIGLAVVVLLARIADRLRIAFIDNLEAILYDARLRLTMPLPGNDGIARRVPDAVMGDAVDFASRLKGITKEYGADIIVGDMAENKLHRLKNISPQAIRYDAFLQRIAFLRENPPPGLWDGVFTFLSQSK